ncbi:methionine ABC transporter ATP-binding protein [Bifidobacterium crudilactis]|jgi:D-methionine transport system ATP-binding protein|uniref:ATP-binding cassette domain-containing protein n=1 Tax=Bifidobacterium crudilactis TaxID=327277 RepID=A0A971CYK5_9BIFI|nr:ATP-binding cassette domain-containing protein [Bifidobacterium crudilactis]MCI1869230.1 ATP-binding cassette domain-containing protein [Bifidobacterium crudilactis]MDN5972441.1 ATP-binding cassette domain-containing protein [Bifidobacterium crudilactis]MDN6000351.1 ATP-binding cassette domain-containing protein [Bifidobacterium crudilactis]MDN6210256.1 ATP-binding cassette domain-containing protein [Bifidobacterium crudilactis]MDN6467293.1 ATP-binding cassette domain-containing protein [Bi
MAQAIAVKQLTKRYHGDDVDTTALHDVNLSIEDGDIYGIIGLSGAGKSTLVRCINGLERYNEGSLSVHGQEVGSLSRKNLRLLRRGVGMIFQSFNLMPSRTVAGNVELAFRDPADKAARKARVAELLELVGLTDKADDYPSELSGGQKQRVAIARALVNRPSILLSDEATSALDPNTTKSILSLLRNLHDTLGLTIVIITHQMAVIKQICNKVAVIDQGSIVEEGKVFDIFVNPQAELTRSFVATTSNLDKIHDLLESDSPLVALDDGEVLLRMQYVSKEASEALISRISRDFDIDANIIFGDIDLIENAPLGGLVVVLKGGESNIAGAIDYLRNRHIGIEVLRHA